VRADVKALETRLEIVEKMQWAVIAGVIALVLKAYFM
jgi:hypothetical protein